MYTRKPKPFIVRTKPTKSPTQWRKTELKVRADFPSDDDSTEYLEDPAGPDARV